MPPDPLALHATHADCGALHNKFDLHLIQRAPLIFYAPGPLISLGALDMGYQTAPHGSDCIVEDLAALFVCTSVKPFSTSQGVKFIRVNSLL